MGILNLFKPKKKRAVYCALTNTPIPVGEGRLVTTAEVIVSEKFWESIMTEPEAMAYTINYFKNNDNTAAMMRNAIFNKYAERSEPWIISEDCIQTYGIETALNGTEILDWWDSDGTFKPDKSGKAIDVLPADLFDKARKYAITEAGKSRVFD
ncbi:MAG: hypothetical protein ABFS32_07170 [Bacteroidota bacterium]